MATSPEYRFFNSGPPCHAAQITPQDLSFCHMNRVRCEHSSSVTHNPKLKTSSWSVQLGKMFSTSCTHFENYVRIVTFCPFLFAVQVNSTTCMCIKSILSHIQGCLLVQCSLNYNAIQSIFRGLIKVSIRNQKCHLSPLLYG